ncbi:hypothetical protein PR001_g4000 [Phytophthora rubi]|uniref:Uncharacterized protein n=1 Tax=Phytophthora rubi TaxID=129364 RepID=A0A6A3NR48_9STRA|nr:hypothetical protein PR001_g4000 [Phytophthora rubi]
MLSVNVVCVTWSWPRRGGTAMVYPWRGGAKNIAVAEIQVRLTRGRRRHVAAQSADGALKGGLQHIGTKERKSDQEIAVETRKHRRRQFPVCIKRRLCAEQRPPRHYGNGSEATGGEDSVVDVGADADARDVMCRGGGGAVVAGYDGDEVGEGGAVALVVHSRE